MELKKTILEVPYFSQYIDVPDYEWNIRSCGAACLKMVLDFKGAKTPDLYQFVKEGNAVGAYGPHGWIHDKLLQIASTYGIGMYREEKMDLDSGIRKIAENIEQDKPVIVSVIKTCLGQIKFHMVVIVGVEKEEGIVNGLYFNEPESTTAEKGKDVFVRLEEFKKDWRRMAIFIG
jgi:hypothetical protein